MFDFSSPNRKEESIVTTCLSSFSPCPVTSPSSYVRDHPSVSPFQRNSFTLNFSSLQMIITCIKSFVKPAKLHIKCELIGVVLFAHVNSITYSLVSVLLQDSLYFVLSGSVTYHMLESAVPHKRDIKEK